MLPMEEGKIYTAALRSWGFVRGCMYPLVASFIRKVADHHIRMIKKAKLAPRK